MATLLGTSLKGVTSQWLIKFQAILGLPNFGVQSNSMFQNLVNTPLGVQSGFQNAIASTPFGVAQSAFGSSFGGTFLS